MEEAKYAHISPGMEVYDVDNHKIGTVAHVYEREPVAVTAAVAGDRAGRTEAAAGGESVFEVKTGLFGLGKHWYIPFRAVHDVTEGGIFLTRSRADFDQLGWRTKPVYLVQPDQMDIAAAPEQAAHTVHPSTAERAPVHPESAPGRAEAIGPAGTIGAPPTGAAAAADWDAVKSHYRARWVQRYSAPGAQWERYEPRYRFTWEMQGRPDFEGRSWESVEPNLRRTWEVLHPETEWGTVADTIRDAWEHPVIPEATGTAGGATS